jgi:hypothetical protein
MDILEFHFRLKLRDPYILSQVNISPIRSGCSSSHIGSSAPTNSHCNHRTKYIQNDVPRVTDVTRLWGLILYSDTCAPLSTCPYTSRQPLLLVDTELAVHNICEFITASPWPEFLICAFRAKILCYMCILSKSCYCSLNRPPLWSSCQSSWLQIQRSRVRFPALPDFLRSSGCGKGSTQPREYK